SPEAAQSCADASLSDPRNAALSSQSARRIEGTCSCQTHGMRPSRHLVAKLRGVDLVVRPTECGPLVTRTRSARTFTLLSDPRNAALSSPDSPLDQRREALSDPRNAALSSPEPSCLGEIVKLSDPRNAALSSPEQALEALRTLLSDPRNAALSSPSR